jgi:hypothetical protein
VIDAGPHSRSLYHERATLHRFPSCAVGATVARGVEMARETDQTPSVTEDGFGARSVIVDSQHGRIERLDLTPALAVPASEQAIRARAAYHNGLEDNPLGRVVRISRNGETLTVFSTAPDGVPLSELLAALEFKTISLSGGELLELASSIVTALATMHERLPTIAHGALTPAHIVLQRDGSTVLTGAVFVDALQALQRSREHLWRDFGLALPPSATAPRFDQRGDVSQLGAVVLAITQRRSLRSDEYPKNTQEMAMSVTVTGNPITDSKLRTWLQDALQLHGRVSFSSGVDAARGFHDALSAPAERMLEALALQAAIRQLCGDAGSPAVIEDILPHQRAS